MSCSSVDKLKDTVCSCIHGFHLDSKMVTNPAYQTVVSQVAGLLDNREVNDDAVVMEEDDAISVQWSSPTVRRYSLTVASSSSNSLQAVLVIHFRPFEIGGLPVHSKHFVELTASALNDGTMNITARQAVLSDKDCLSFGWYYSYEKLLSYYYDKDGTKMDFEYQAFPERVVDGFVDSSTLEDAFASISEEKKSIK